MPKQASDSCRIRRQQIRGTAQIWRQGAPSWFCQRIYRLVGGSSGKGARILYQGVCRHHRIAREQFEAAGGAVKSQSERQLGAFMFLYLREMGEHLPLNKRIPEIRNRIVHQGRIAKEAEAREFGELVFGRIRQIERALERLPAASAGEAAHELEVQRQSVAPDIEQGTFQVRSVLVEEGEVTGPTSTFAQYIAALRQGIEKGLA